MLDAGCGSGATSRAAAGRAASVVGVDISGPMLARARAHATDVGLANVEFVEADAQEHSFDAEFDVVVSRFGVMFFDDPVAAFTNFASHLGRKNRRPSIPGATASPSAYGHDPNRSRHGHLGDRWHLG